ncbi:hypothetical protein Tco_1144079 [Tanacetum coccineum]
MKAHCVNLELKYQNQPLKFGQHGQIVNETSNKAKIKKEIEVLETIDIELEHSLLAKNEQLKKENEHLKQNYKDLYDFIKKIRIQTKDHNDSLIAQVNIVDTTGTPLSTSINQDAPSASALSTIYETQSPVLSQGVEEQLQSAQFDNDPFQDILTSEPSSQESSSNLQSTNHQPLEPLSKWTKNHLLANVIDNPSRPVSTRKQLQTNAMWCYFDAFLTSVEPKNYK